MIDVATHAQSLPRTEATRDTTGLVIYRASRLEALLDPFRDLLAATWPDNPLMPQTVIAAHPGIKQWLSGALARRMGPGGIVANLDVVLSSTWIDRLAQARLGEQAIALPRYQRGQLRWNLYEWLGDAASVPGLGDARIERFLHPEGTDEAERGRRRFQLADRLAKLYSQYLVYRPDWLAAWQRGQFRFATGSRGDAALAATEAQLLGPLWRHAALALGPHRAEVMTTLIDALRGDAGERPPLHVFGVSHLAPRELDALHVYAERALVAMYLPDPCRDYWGVLDDGPAEAWRAAETRAIEAAGEGDWWRPQRHELLSRWGRLGQHFFSAIAALDVREDIRHWRDTDNAPASNRLERLQASIRGLDEGLLVPAAGIEDELRDASLRVHACHTPLRELEVLRDAMLDARAAGIEPGEMLVMSPDITRYLPLIPAVFGEAGDPRGPLPYRLADVPTARAHPLFTAFSRLLALPASRITAPEVLDLVSMPEVARRLGLDDEGLAALESLLAESRIAWSLDAAHRAGFGVPGVEAHGFAWGVDRMLAGYLMNDASGEAMQAASLPDGTELLPLARVENAHATAVGALDALLQQVQRLQDLSSRTLRASEWRQAFEALTEALFRVDPQDRAAREASETLKRLVGSLQAETEAAGVDPELHWSVASARLQAALDAVPQRQAFLLGGATFCGMVPQRAIPFRFIAVLGLDDGEFPRIEYDGGLDLMARLRRVGDREQRIDDRYLFLETVMSARERLHLGYIGEGVRDGQPRNPAAPLAELMAMLERADAAADARDGVADAPSRVKAAPWRLRHPLQPFDARYFDGRDPRLHTYDQRQAALHKPVAESAQTKPGTAEGAGIAITAKPWPDTLPLADLRGYYRDPARHLLQRRAGIRLDALAEDRLGADEPLDDRLGAYDSPARRLFLEDVLPNWPEGEWQPSRAPDWLRLGGRLPSGAIGDRAWQHQRDIVNVLVDAARRAGFDDEVAAQATQADIGLPLDIDGHALHLQGRVGPLFPRTEGGVQLLAFAIGQGGLKKSKTLGLRHRLPVFIDWLALRLFTPPDTPVRLALLTDDAKSSDAWAQQLNDWDAALQAGEADIADARHRLRALLQAWHDAEAHPLRWFPAAADAALAAADVDDATLEDIARKVQAAWLEGFNATGERERSDGHAALLAQGEDFDADSPALPALLAFARQLQDWLWLVPDGARGA